MVPTVVYTDGACSGNPGPGGWAWAVDGGPFASGASADTTNQRMEITAAYEAVRAISGRVEVVSDSTYVVNCFRDRWWEAWLRKGWINSQRKPVANRDLWEPFVELVRDRGEITFRWVKGHAGDPMNDLVDRLAVEAAATQHGRHGTGRPTHLGPADLGPVVATEPVICPATRSSCSATARPSSGATTTIRSAAAVRARLRAIIEAKLVVEPSLVVVSGLQLGAETLGAEAALDAGAPLVVVLPYPNPESVWPEASRARFESLRARAIEVVQLERKAPSSKQQAGAALARRNAWLARHAAEAVLVWDGTDAALGKVHRSLVDHLGEDVWVVDPTELVRQR